MKKTFRWTIMNYNVWYYKLQYWFIVLYTDIIYSVLLIFFIAYKFWKLLMLLCYNNNLVYKKMKYVHVWYRGLGEWRMMYYVRLAILFFVQIEFLSQYVQDVCNFINGRNPIPSQNGCGDVTLRLYIILLLLNLLSSSSLQYCSIQVVQLYSP